MANINWQYLVDLPWVKADPYGDFSRPHIGSILTAYMPGMAENADFKPSYASFIIFAECNGGDKWRCSENWEVLTTEDPGGLNVYIDADQQGVFEPWYNSDSNCVWVDPVYWGNSLHRIGYHEEYEYWFANVGGCNMMSSFGMVLRTPHGMSGQVYREDSFVGYRSPDGSISPI